MHDIPGMNGNVMIVLYFLIDKGIGYLDLNRTSWRMLLPLMGWFRKSDFDTKIGYDCPLRRCSGSPVFHASQRLQVRLVPASVAGIASQATRGGRSRSRLRNRQAVPQRGSWLHSQSRYLLGQLYFGGHTHALKRAQTHTIWSTHRHTHTPHTHTHTHTQSRTTNNHTMGQLGHKVLYFSCNPIVWWKSMLLNQIICL